MSRLRVRFPLLQDFVVLFSVVSLFALQMANFADDPGVGWHLATGAHVHEHGGPPMFDPFLASPQPRPWVSDQWLSDLVLYLLHLQGGWPLLYGVLGLMYLALYFLLLMPLLRRESGSVLASVFVALLAFKLGQLHFILRPTMFGFLLFTITLWIGTGAARVAQHGGAAFGKLVLLCALNFVLWANLHPSFPLGLIWLALLPLGRALDRVLHREPVLVPELLRLSLLPTVGVVAAAVNPYGFGLHEGILALANSSFFMNLHQEWLSPNFKEAEGHFFEATLLLLLGAALLPKRQRFRLSGAELLSVVAFAHLALDAVRVLPYFGLVVSIPLARAFASLGQVELAERSRVVGRLVQSFRCLEELERRSTRGVLAFAAAALAVTVSLVQHSGLPLFQHAFGPTPQRYPYEAVAYLRDASERPVVVMAPPGWGGFLTWEGQGRIRPIIDDRNTLLGEQFYRRFFAIQELPLDPAQLREYLAALEVNYLLLRPSSPLAQLIKTTAMFPIRHEYEVSILFEVTQ